MLVVANKEKRVAGGYYLAGSVPGDAVAVVLASTLAFLFIGFQQLDQLPGSTVLPAGRLVPRPGGGGRQAIHPPHI